MNILATKLLNSSSILSSSSSQTLFFISCVQSIFRKRLSFKAKTEKEANENKPKEVQFTSSPAHVGWKSSYNFFTDPDHLLNQNKPKSNNLVLLGSVAVFLIYFCILREENDIDEIIYQPLIKTLPELEKPLVISAIYDHHKMGLSTKDLRKRLNEIKSQEND